MGWPEPQHVPDRGVGAGQVSDEPSSVGYAVVSDRGWPVVITRDLEVAKAELVRMTVGDMDGAGMSFLRIVKTRFA